MPVTRVLIVDDFLPWQRFVEQMFEPETEFKVTSVAINGFEAVQKARELQPDLVLLDVSLPGINGFEAARRIRDYSPDSKILFVSEHRGPDLIQEAFDVGGSGYVLKSDSEADLILAVRAVLLGRQFVSRSLANWREGWSSPD